MHTLNDIAVESMPSFDNGRSSVSGYSSGANTTGTRSRGKSTTQQQTANIRIVTTIYVITTNDQIMHYAK